MMDTKKSSPQKLRDRRRARRGKRSQPYSNYLLFGPKSITFLLLFSLLYFTFLICFLPMINNVPGGDDDDSTDDDYYVDKEREKHARLREALQRVKRPHFLSKEEIQNAIANAQEKGKTVYLKEKEIMKLVMDKEKEIIGEAKKREKEFVGNVKEKAKRGVEKVKKGFEYLKKGSAGIEKGLLDEAFQEFESIRKNAAAGVGPISPQLPGFMVLGMHRSGTSMLAGLLVQGFGYNVGEPLIQPNFDNKKGFFELLPVVLQNDAFMAAQDVTWSSNLTAFDYEKALDQWDNKQVDKTEGEKALKILKEKGMTPWLQKDPRNCVTIRTWMALVTYDEDGGFPPYPAVVFTYRHPLEVAMSLQKRQGFELIHGLRLWIVYNHLGVQNSQDMCRVETSNTAVLTDPIKETSRIVKELTDRCNVIAPPKAMISQDVVDNFVDPKLQGNRKKLEENEGGVKIIESKNGGNCLIKDFKSEHEEGSSKYADERAMYLRAMKIFCDFESGAAYDMAYEWPKFD